MPILYQLVKRGAKPYSLIRNKIDSFLLQHAFTQSTKGIHLAQNIRFTGSWQLGHSFMAFSHRSFSCHMLCLPFTPTLYAPFA